MLHFHLESSSESLPTKKLMLFCPFLFGAPYQVSFSVYALGKKVDSGFLPNDYLNKISDLLDTLFSLQLCLGIHDEKLLKTIKMRKPVDDSGNDCEKTSQIDTKFVLSNRFGKHIKDTIRNIISVFEFMLIDLFNIFLSLPGNLPCFVSPFEPYMVHIFVKDWHGKTHVFRLLQTAPVSDQQNKF